MYRTEIGGVPIPDIAKTFGTPTYVYDRSMIERRVRDLSAFPVVRYAQKANSTLAVLDLMRRLGVVVDAVSAGEVHRALKAGFRPDQIVFTADVFDHDALAVVKQLDLHVNCGSPDMIRQLGAHGPGRKATLRINPGFGHGHSRKTNTGGDASKHGIWHADLADVLALAKEAGVVVNGIHMHIGSGADFEHLAQVAGALTDAALQVGPDLEIVSAGGGLPTPSRPGDVRIDVAAYAELWKKTH
ncbi:MAG: diaminopimelate decarboxylase family protein, partial [Planctomycetia bacterium]